MKRVVLLLGFMIGVGQAAPIDSYMKGLEAEAKKENPSFTAFDAKRGEKIFFSKHIGKKARGYRVQAAILET